MNKLVSVVIATCGRNHYYLTCLEAVAGQTHRSLDIILINNALDESVSQKALAVYPLLRIYSPERNLYYCDSMNKGIEMSRGEFVLCLNDDVFLEEGFLAEALKGFEVASNIGMVSGRLLRLDKKTIDSTGLFVSVFRTAKERGYGQVDHGQFDRDGLVFGVGGAAALYRKSMLDQIREGECWFDPDFRMFYEDLDVAWRANRRGWRAYYKAQAKACHVRGGSVRINTGADKPFARKYLDDDFHADLIKNRYLTMIKNESPLGLIVHLLPILLYDLCAWGYILLFSPGVVRIVLGKCHNIGVSGSRGRSGCAVK